MTPNRLTEVDIRRLATRWREHQESLSGQPVPAVPPELREVADRTDAQLLLAHAPHLALPVTAQRSEVSHVI